eukprot:3662506-Rhodomonas_salina.3
MPDMASRPHNNDRHHTRASHRTMGSEATHASANVEPTDDLARLKDRVKHFDRIWVQSAWSPQSALGTAHSIGSGNPRPWISAYTPQSSTFLVQIVLNLRFLVLHFSMHAARIGHEKYHTGHADQLKILPSRTCTPAFVVCIPEPENGRAVYIFFCFKALFQRLDLVATYGLSLTDIA